MGGVETLANGYLGGVTSQPQANSRRKATTAERHRVVVVGGGFGGLYAVRALATAAVDITLIDRVNHHLFQPLLYQVATGILSEGEIAPALRSVLRGQNNVKVLLAEVTGFDVAAQTVTATEPDGRSLQVAYDSLIVATGMAVSYFGHDEWQTVAPGLKSLDDARALRSHILGAFEMAELARTPAERAAWLTFVVVGAGPTGVELTGEIATLAHGVLPRDFRDVATHDSRVLLLDAGPAILPTFPESLRRRAAADLRGWGVEIRTGTAALAIDDTGIDVKHPDGSEQRLAARTVCWAAGVKAAPLAATLAAAAGTPADRLGRLFVQPDLTLPGHTNVFAIGDMAALDNLPGVAQVAMQQGRYVAASIVARLAGQAAPPAFAYRDKGTMATVGPRRAVVDAYGLRIGGFAGSMMWAFIHVMYLIGWGNRVITVLRWLLQLTTRNRSQRLVDVRHATRWRTGNEIATGNGDRPPVAPGDGNQSSPT
ncbi:MAG: NAD(P)/FAD-dependent oxidoreductase [Thermoleophilia bacterium]